MVLINSVFVSHPTIVCVSNLKAPVNLHVSFDYPTVVSQNIEALCHVRSVSWPGSMQGTLVTRRTIRRPNKIAAIWGSTRFGSFLTLGMWAWESTSKLKVGFGCSSQWIANSESRWQERQGRPCILASFSCSSMRSLTEQITGGPVFGIGPGKYVVINKHDTKPSLVITCDYMIILLFALVHLLFGRVTTIRQDL